MGLLRFGTDMHAIANAPAFAFTGGASPSVSSLVQPVLAPLKYTLIAGSAVGFLIAFISGIAFMKIKFILLLGAGIAVVVHLLTK